MPLMSYTTMKATYVLYDIKCHIWPRKFGPLLMSYMILSVTNDLYDIFPPCHIRHCTTSMSYTILNARNVS